MATHIVLCIGSLVVEMRGLLQHDSPPNGVVPGVTFLNVGGVAQNMAANFTRLGYEAYLLSAVGKDIFGGFALSVTQEQGIRTDLVEEWQDLPTARLVALLDADGDTIAGVFDGPVIERISTTYLARQTEMLESASLITANTILPLDSLSWLAAFAGQHRIPFYVNATSAHLARRITAVMDASPIIGANKLEAEALAGKNITSPADAIAVGKRLVLQGARQAIITLGPEGVVVCDLSNSYHREALPAHVVNTIGAGDALCSGFLWSILEGYDLPDSMEFGLAAAALTVECPTSSLPNLSPSLVSNRIERTRE